MQRYNFFHGQTVLESDMDNAFDAVEDAEHNLVIDGHDRQVLVADTPDPSSYGGIVKGLVVSGTTGDDHVDVTVGVARDNQGRRVNLSGAASVKITHTGTTPEGDVTDALGAGGAITGTCSNGKWIVASLFLVYAEALTDPKTDALGNTVYYNVAESFSFDIQIGSTEFTHSAVVASPPTATPTRAALADGKVLIAEMILYNSGGNMQLADVLVAGGDPNIMLSSVDWDKLGGNYATLTGRRSSWLTVRTDEEFADADADADFLRGNSARECLHDLGKKVRSSLVVAHKRTAAPVLFSKRGIYGHPHLPHEFFDEFHYQAAQIDLTNANMGPWLLSSNGALVATTDNYVEPSTALGGAVVLFSKAGVVEWMQMDTRPMWNLGATPFAICSFRWWQPAATPGNTFAGFYSVAGTEHIYVGHNTVSGNIEASARGPLGYGATVNLGAFVADTEYATRIAVLSASEIYVQINSGAWTNVPLSAGDSFPSTRYTLRMLAATNGVTKGSLLLDQAYAADGQLQSDML